MLTLLYSYNQYQACILWECRLNEELYTKHIQFFRDLEISHCRNSQNQIDHMITFISWNWSYLCCCRCILANMHACQNAHILLPCLNVWNQEAFCINIELDLHADLFTCLWMEVPSECVQWTWATVWQIKSFSYIARCKWMLHCIKGLFVKGFLFV